MVASNLSPNIIFYYLALQSIMCFIPSESIGFSLRLIPRFSPESPLYPGNLTFEERIDKAIEIARLRANYLDYLSTPNQSLSVNNIHLWVKPDSFGQYTAAVALGTPAMPQNMLVDTGSSVIWSQCRPCTKCYSQSIPIFNREASTTYTKVPCDDPICARHECINGECMYKVIYADGGVSRGLVSKEMFSFESRRGLVRVPNIVFGCGNDNEELTTSENTSISGILGLGMGSDSLTKQLFNQIRGRFSYCLVYAHVEVIARSLLRFGEDTVLPWRQDIQTIGIVRQQRFHTIYVPLIDVSVGDKRLGFPRGTFDLDINTGRGGCIFDTGALGMYFPKGSVYDAVMKEFDDHFIARGLKRMYNSSEHWKYCYMHDPKFHAYTSMTLHFPSANFIVQPRYMYSYVKSRELFCVAVFESPGDMKKSIIGSWMQRDMRLLYDLSAGEIRFMPENCAADQ